MSKFARQMTVFYLFAALGLLVTGFFVHNWGFWSGAGVALVAAVLIPLEDKLDRRRSERIW